MKRIIALFFTILAAAFAAAGDATPNNKETTTMNIHFLGTGAADWDWENPLDSSQRGSCSTLLDGHILIDAGRTVMQEINRDKVNPAEITDLLITHSHADHFVPSEIRKIATAPGRTQKLHVYASPESIAELDDSVEKTPLKAGQSLKIGEFTVRVIPANHVLGNPEEPAFHYVIITPNGKKLLYALDGGWMISRARLLLQEHAPLDMIIWDATCGATLDDWRFADHNDLEMIRSMRESMSKLKIIRPDTVHYFDHTARTLWPEDAAERAKLEKKYKGILAEDGMKTKL